MESPSEIDSILKFVACQTECNHYSSPNNSSKTDRYFLYLVVYPYAIRVHTHLNFSDILNKIVLIANLKLPIESRNYNLNKNSNALKSGI